VAGENRRPAAGESPYGKVPDTNPTQARSERNPPTIQATNARGPSQSLGSKKTFKIIEQAKKAKRVFAKALLKPFKANNVKADKWIDHEGGLVEISPGAGTFRPEQKGILGKYLGGGANAAVYQDSANPEYVHKLVALTWIQGKELPPDYSQSPENTVTDQSAGYEMLNRFKATYKGKTLDKLFEVAERSEVSMFSVMSGNAEKFYAHTREKNISSAVYFKDAAGRGHRILDDNNQPVTANNAENRIELRIKEKKRQEALKRGQHLKLSEIQVGQDEIGTGLTRAEEATLNAVLRGLNHQGIVWQDHKLSNIDIVSDFNSPTGHKVIFFDYDGLRPVQGSDRATRARNARDLQRTYDLDTKNIPAPNDIETEKKLFDYKAFDVKHLETMFSQNANTHRRLLSSFNGMDDQTFNSNVMDNVLNQVQGLRGRAQVGQVQSIEYE
jgi:hypothetical protein